MSTQYTLTVNNKASSSAYLMIFQNDPTLWDPNALALAWLSKYSNPGPTVTVKFRWTIDWGFSWADTGELKPGIVFETSQTAKASDGNQITLDYNGAYFFTDQKEGVDPNRLYMRESGNIPVGSKGSVGITMSGSTVYATQAKPNNNLTGSPKPSYYLAYGNYVEGDVIDVSSVNNPLLLPYDTGIYNLTTTLNKDDTWTTPVTSSVMNDRILAAKENCNNKDKHWTELDLVVG